MAQNHARLTAVPGDGVTPPLRRQVARIPIEWFNGICFPRCQFSGRDHVVRQMSRTLARSSLGVAIRVTKTGKSISRETFDHPGLRTLPESPVPPGRRNACRTGYRGWPKLAVFLEALWNKAWHWPRMSRLPRCQAP